MICQLAGMRAAAAYFRERAELFRQLADTLGGHHDQVAAQLRAIADEFDANAHALERRIMREAAHLSHNEEASPLH